MFHLIYVSCDSVNTDGAESWAEAHDVPLAKCRLIREIEFLPECCVVVDWSFCLDRDRLEEMLAEHAARVPIAVHGYHFDDEQRRCWLALGVNVCRYQAEALDAVRIALAKAA